MSAQEFKPGDRVRCVRSSATSSNPAVTAGDEYVIAVRDGDMVSVDGMPSYWWSTDRFEKVEPEFVVGQQVSGDDYARLPVGARAAFRGVGSGITKVGEHEWHDSHGCPLFDVTDFPRILTHLPDATDPEDKDDLYVEPEHVTEPSVDNSEDLTEPEDADDVEPEPLKEGDACLIWATVRGVADDRAVHVDITTRHAHALGLVPHADAIVRPDAGQVPPWVKPARCTSLLMVDKTTDLRQCTRDGDGHDNHVAYGASWKDHEAYGRVVVSDGAS